jgi:hypothetical protein
MITLAVALALTAAPDTLYARAESLLAAGALSPAWRIAERLERGFPGLGGERVTTIAFARETAALSRVHESLVILLLEILDERRGARASSASVTFELH